MLTTLSSVLAILTPTMAGLASIIVMTNRATNLLNRIHYKIELLEAKDKNVALEIHEIRKIVESNQKSIVDLENWASTQSRMPKFRLRGRK